MRNSRLKFLWKKACRLKKKHSVDHRTSSCTDIDLLPFLLSAKTFPTSGLRRMDGKTRSATIFHWTNALKRSKSRAPTAKTHGKAATGLSIPKNWAKWRRRLSNGEKKTHRASCAACRIQVWSLSPYHVDLLVQICPIIFSASDFHSLVIKISAYVMRWKFFFNSSV